ncbi:hypothetical protein DYB34_005158 [Aphanomyces astaci]|uniref:G protein gamma domain-containing protein n=1 Tax=Aphanomyces astaci TaxID=112090 RepID=A0A3R6VXG5_APHAT|nr:hypothetical protein DYB34_005158 [Aphanomyces astaci]
MQLWTCVQKRVHLKAIDTMLHRARMGLPFQMTNRREARERAMYTKVDVVKLARILDMDVAVEMSKLETLFSDQYGAQNPHQNNDRETRSNQGDIVEDVQRIFKYYAASDVGDACSMSLDEFHRFLKDCKLVTKSLGLAYVKKIFNEINQVEDKSVQCDIDDDDDDEQNEVLPRTGLSLSQRVKKCLVEYILANACRSSTDAFRHQMNAIECKAVFQTYQTKLEQIYRRYAAQSSSLNGQGFVALLEAYDLFTDVLTVGDVKHVLKKIQQESDDAPESGAAVTTDVDLEVKKLSDEIERLELDLKALEAAITTSEAAKKYVVTLHAKSLTTCILDRVSEYCNTTPDPFLGDNESPNVWQAAAQGGGGCVIQ